MTGLLSELASGNQLAAEKLVPMIYGELKRLARAYMRRERTDHTLQTTALVHEAYLRLVRQESLHLKGRAHFFGIAARLMRQILIDHARGHLREKRGGALVFLPLDEELAFSPQHSEELLVLDAAMDRLAKRDARLSQVVELRFFGGLSMEETAEFLGVSTKTVKRDWAVAKAWLHREVSAGHGDHSRSMGTS